jgi:hypothetical protein
LPPLLAISRCFSELIDAKPRLAVEFAIVISLANQQFCSLNQPRFMIVPGDFQQSEA